MDILLFVISRVEQEQEEPTSLNAISTFDTAAVLVSVCK